MENTVNKVATPATEKEDMLVMLSTKLIMQAKHYGYCGVLETTLRQIESQLFSITGEEIVVGNNTIL